MTPEQADSLIYFLKDIAKSLDWIFLVLIWATLIRLIAGK